MGKRRSKIEEPETPFEAPAELPDPALKFEEPMGVVETPKIDYVPEVVPGPIPEPPRVVVNVVPLDVFLVVSGVRRDQIAGFSRWAKSAGLEPRSIPDWRTTYAEFLKRPMR